MLPQFLAYLGQERGPLLMGQFVPLQKCRVAGLDPVRCLLLGHVGVGLNFFLGRGIDRGNCRLVCPLLMIWVTLGATMHSLLMFGTLGAGMRF